MREPGEHGWRGIWKKVTGQAAEQERVRQAQVAEQQRCQ